MRISRVGLRLSFAAMPTARAREVSAPVFDGSKRLCSKPRPSDSQGLWKSRAPSHQTRGRETARGGHDAMCPSQRWPRCSKHAISVVTEAQYPPLLRRDLRGRRSGVSVRARRSLARRRALHRHRRHAQRHRIRARPGAPHGARIRARRLDGGFGIGARH